MQKRRKWRLGPIEMTILLFVVRAKHNFHRIDLCLDLANHGVSSISRNDLGVVQHVELLCGIATGVEKDGLLASRVVRKEL